MLNHARLTMHANNAIIITAIQEELLQAMGFWVANLQRLQQVIDPEQFMTVLPLNQAQMMRQYLEDDARADKEQVAKAQTSSRQLVIGRSLLRL